jgi:hypothetical protein
VAITLVPAFSYAVDPRIELHHLDAAANNRNKLKVKYRFLLLSVCAMIFNSLTFVFWSLPIPKGTPGV